LALPGNTTETLLARWAGLAAWSGFYRNHNGDTSRPQEFYRFPLAAEAARAAIDLRYRLLDVFYTSIVRAERDGTPTQQPVFYNHPEDRTTLPIETQWYFAGKILVSPVLEENSTSVTAYLPNATYYDVQTLTPLVGEGRNVTFDNVGYSTVPAHILGGTILPMRAESANTTTALRTKPFSLVVAPRSASNSSAVGELILDDGESLEPEAQTDVVFRLDNNTLSANGTWDYEAVLASIVFAGQTASRSLSIDGGEARQPSAFNETSQTLRFDGLNMTMTANWTAVLA
jgi:alpha-glucosidase